ncbi:A structural comparison of 21 inhibitor complexes of the aspartic proteinase [Thozetella sp. PMI_491]|nr:A structural comparison of 21 inhibitor complexes of the aspartic proteinase [Thozetella sp. PMI_491]
MTLVQLALAALAGSGFVAAAPGLKIGTILPENAGPGRSTVTVRSPTNFNATMSLYKTMLKYGKKPSASLEAAVAEIQAAALAKRSTGEVSATPNDEYDDAYLSPVSIGTPAQSLNLDFDTGSSDFWVFSSLTPSSQVNGQSTYNPSSSSSSKLVSGATWSITYGDQSTSSGVVYTDTVTIGGVTFASQQVEAAKSVSSSFTSDSSIDGLVGLGFDNINTVRPTAAKTFFSNIKSSLDQPLFTVDLKHQATGTYDFGFIDTAKYTGSITYTSVSTTNGWWQFTSSGYQVGSNSFVSSSINGIADTGTTLLFLPTAVINAWYGKFTQGLAQDSQGLLYFHCTETAPSLTFGVGSARITIPSKILNLGVGDSTGTWCVGGLQNANLIGINIFGDVALKAAFVVFDGSSTPRLGWASKTV